MPNKNSSHTLIPHEFKELIDSSPFYSLQEILNIDRNIKRILIIMGSIIVTTSGYYIFDCYLKSLNIPISINDILSINILTYLLLSFTLLFSLISPVLLAYILFKNSIKKYYKNEFTYTFRYNIYLLILCFILSLYLAPLIKNESFLSFLILTISLLTLNYYYIIESAFFISLKDLNINLKFITLFLSLALSGSNITLIIEDFYLASYKNILRYIIYFTINILFLCIIWIITKHKINIKNSFISPKNIVNHTTEFLIIFSLYIFFEPIHLHSPSTLNIYNTIVKNLNAIYLDLGFIQTPNNSNIYTIKKSYLLDMGISKYFKSNCSDNSHFYYGYFLWHLGNTYTFCKYKKANLADLKYDKDNCIVIPSTEISFWRTKDNYDKLCISKKM